MNYKERDDAGNVYRGRYLDSIEELIKQKQSEADEKRKVFFADISKDADKYRNELKKMLGWPLTDGDYSTPTMLKELIVTEDKTNVYRVTIDMPIGIKFYGIFFEHNDAEKLPLIIAQHGGEGAPELCSGLMECGTINYNDMVMRIYNKGVNVFAPQLLLWNKERFSMEYDRLNIDARLKQLGSSISAVEIYCIMKAIDCLSEFSCVDKNRIGMVGLSYGGFYTLFTSALDIRIKGAIACSQYNDRYKYSWVDWTWMNAANLFMDNEVARLIYPRYLCLLVGEDDSLFAASSAETEWEKLKQMTIDNTWVDFQVFEGAHEFIKDDECIDKLLSIL